MTLSVNTANHIEIDGSDTGLGYLQRESGTVVFTRQERGENYQEHAMPHARYSLAHDKPASGAAGRTQFETGIKALLKTI
jgi:hypothetical protein